MVEWFDAGSVAGEKQLASDEVVDGESEHPSEAEQSLLQSSGIDKPDYAAHA